VTRDQRWIAGFAIGLLVHVAATRLALSGELRGSCHGGQMFCGDAPTTVAFARFGGTFAILALGSA
jgi:hypothetical protein